jgi:Spy/CpxP family protein refolding chaperone
MQISKKGVALGVIIAILIILNIITLTTIWTWKPAESRPAPQGEMMYKPDGRMVFEKELNFTPQQMDSVDKYRKEHFDVIHKYMDESKKYKDELFEQMKNPDNAKVQELISKIADVQKNIETETFNHFMKIRNLCDDKQKEKFSEIMKKILVPEPRDKKMMDGEMPPHERPGHEPRGSNDMRQHEPLVD